MNLGSFLDRAAQKYPHKTAVICEGNRATYSMLHTRVEKLAASLYQYGITKGAKAGILAYNSIEYIEIIFALMKLGAVCVPLNHRLTPEDIKELVNHAGVATLFYDKELEPIVPFGTQGIKNFIPTGCDKTSDSLSCESLFSSPAGTYPDQNITEADDSFLIYTAGTTGRPKGVVLTHGNQISNTRNYTAAYGMQPHDIELAPTPLFHSSTLGRVFTYIYNCSTFILCRKFEPESCLDLIQQEKVTSITQAPTMYHMMLHAIKKGEWDTRSVKRVVTGASPMTPQAKAELKDLFPHAGFFDLYGLTEAAPGVSILMPPDFERKAESVGTPMPSVDVLIKDENGAVLPSSQIGEIVCRGPNIMKGYYHDPEATAEVLQQGWLHTGDMGMLDDEGYIYICGRKKEIIISGGENIYPGEVEIVLLGHPAIHDAAVIGLPDDTWGEKTAAAVVLKENRQCTEEEIIAFCKKHLAGFKCPRAVCYIKELPRNATQKVLRKELQKYFL